MNRLGFRFDNLRRTLPELLASANLELEAVYTHFATADDPGVAAVRAAAAAVRARAGSEIASLARAEQPPLPSRRQQRGVPARLRVSGSIASGPGCCSTASCRRRCASTIELAPVMTLVSRVVAVKGMRPGEISGYGARFTAERPTTIAVVPAGYADGLDLRLAGRGAVLIRGRRAPIVGSVCMDMLMADVTGLEVSPGDEVVIIGSQGERSHRRARDGRRDRHDSLGGRVPGRLAIERVYSERRLATATAGSDVMAKRPSTVFVCQECGAQSPKWLGRCADCGAWNSLVEERAAETRPRGSVGHRYAVGSAPAPARLYADIEIGQHARLSTGIDEFDRVLGGGIVPGSLVLLGGEPGIGKSTLLLQAAANMARTIGPVLYSSGEESEHQIKSRGERLGGRRRAAVSAGGNLSRAHPRRDRPPQAGAGHRRFDPDGLLAQVPVGARQHRPGARSGDAAAVHGEGPEHADVARRPRHEGRQPRRARRRSSTSSTRCCTSRASVIIRIASCARSRTGSAR